MHGVHGRRTTEQRTFANGVSPRDPWVFDENIQHEGTDGQISPFRRLIWALAERDIAGKMKLWMPDDRVCAATCFHVNGI